jgi:molybdopterin-guanine dinucleotide biosynthesis protein A
MGQDKALVSIGRETLLQHVCAVAQQCAQAVFVVTPWTERYQALLGQLAADPVYPPIHWVPEQLAKEQRPQGPLRGFAQGLAQIQSIHPPLQTDWVLLLACDLPNLQADVLQDWAARLSDMDADINAATIALLPQNPQGWWEPLCGFYRRRCLADLDAFIQAGGRSFQRWLESQQVQVLPLSDPRLLFNCNTPEDLATFHASHHQTDASFMHQSQLQ